MHLEEGNYTWIHEYVSQVLSFSSEAGRKPKIVEVGSRDAIDAILLSVLFDCQVVAFEPNPAAFRNCFENISLAGANVMLRIEALYHENGMVPFYSVDTTLYPNIGASSLFQIDFLNRSHLDQDRRRTPIQVKTEVKASRFDSLDLEAPDLLVMDAEGSELKVLEGFGDELHKVRFIALEVAPIPMHFGGCDFASVHKFLVERGFTFVASRQCGRGLWRLQMCLFRRRMWSRIRNLVGRKRIQGFYDVLYRNSSLT